MNHDNDCEEFQELFRS